MQGTRWRVDRTSAPSGIIPAHAGNTHTGSKHHIRCWDHPRACGEHVKDCFVIDLGQSKRKDKLIHQLERYNDREWKIRRLFILDGEGFLEIKLK